MDLLTEGFEKYNELLTNERSSKIEDVVRWRQQNFTVVLENIHDPHNLGAIIRSCDAAGIGEVHVIYHLEGINSDIKYIGKRASRGAAKWVDVSFYDNIEDCILMLKSRGFSILATALHANSENLYDTDLTKSIAIVFGNEKEGITKDLLSYCDGNIVIPMFGMVQSLNVSNAAAVILFEMVRQRHKVGNYSVALNAQDDRTVSLLNEYIARTRPRIAQNDIKVIGGFVDQILSNNKEK